MLKTQVNELAMNALYNHFFDPPLGIALSKPFVSITALIACRTGVVADRKSCSR